MSCVTGKTLADVNRAVVDSNSSQTSIPQQHVPQGQSHGNQGHLQGQGQFNPHPNNLTYQTRGGVGNRGNRGRGQARGRGQYLNQGHVNSNQGQPISVVGQTHQGISTVSNVKRGQGRSRGSVRGRGGHNVQNFGQLQQVHIEENIDYDSFENVPQQSNRTVIPSSQMTMSAMGAASQGQEGSGRTVIAGGEQRVSEISLSVKQCILIIQVSL